MWMLDFFNTHKKVRSNTFQQSILKKKTIYFKANILAATLSHYVIPYFFVDRLLFCKAAT